VPDEAAVTDFWTNARRHARLDNLPGYFGPGALESVQPPAWWFGGTPSEADALLALVLEGTKTATASALRDYEAEDEPLPEPGTMSILLDGSGRPRALLATTDVRVVPFAEVDAEHAHLEGEGDRSLDHWREVHERFLTDSAQPGEAFTRDLPVVLERFEVLHRE